MPRAHRFEQLWQQQAKNLDDPADDSEAGSPKLRHHIDVLNGTAEELYELHPSGTLSRASSHPPERANLALPPSTAGQPLRTFEVVKPFEGETGTVAPAFGQCGFGTQFRTAAPLEVLFKRGFLQEVSP